MVSKKLGQLQQGFSETFKKIELFKGKDLNFNLNVNFRLFWYIYNKTNCEPYALFLMLRKIMIILIDNMNVQKLSYVIIEQFIITDISAISYKVILLRHQDKQCKIQAVEYSKTFLVT